MKMDIDAGIALGYKTILVTTGPQEGTVIANPHRYAANTLLEVTLWIIGDRE